MRNQVGIKIELQKKVHRRICVRIITFLTARPPFYVTFCCFLPLLLPPSQVTYLLHGPYKDTWYCYGLYSVRWYHEWTVENMKIFCNLILAGWHKNVIYFRLCFSFSCSGCNLTLIKKSHTLNFYLFLQKFLSKTKTYNKKSRTLNFYSFLQKFLLKVKTYKLVVGNCGSSI